MGLRDRLRERAQALLRRDRAPAPVAAAVPTPTEAAPDGYVAVGPADKVPEGGACTFPFAGGVVAVFRRGGRLYATENACRHEDGPVGEGAVEGTRVRCPYHDWEYDFTTGACLTDPSAALATWAVREAEGRVWVGRRLTEGTAARGGEHNDGLETIIR